MKFKKNKFKRILKSGRFSIGLWNGIMDSYVAEIIAGAGYDWILIDGEHAPFELQDIIRHHQILSSYDVGIIVRPPNMDRAILKRLLDAGVQSFLIPMMETPEQAKELVQSVTYPPEGRRGVGTGLARAAQWNRVPDYFKKADKEICLIVQIETVQGMKNIEAIANTDGIDGLFIGPADLAASMGYLGSPSHKDIRKEVKRGMKIIKKSGKFAGTIALSTEIAQEYAKAGADFMGVGIDLQLVAKASSQQAKELKELLS